jgi:hypothetical protein
MPAPRRNVRSTPDGSSAVQPPGLSYTAHWKALGCASQSLEAPDSPTQTLEAPDSLPKQGGTKIAVRGHGEAIMETKLVESVLARLKQAPESVATADFPKRERSGRFPR